MDIEIKKWLHDISHSIEEVEQHHFKIFKKNFKEYQKNPTLKRAVERNLEIIGEAVNRILKKDTKIKITNAKSIVGLRNHIIHSYDNITDEMIWAIISKHLPKLKKEIKSLLKE